MNPLSGMTYRDLVRHYGLEICETVDGCPAGLSRVAHIRGRADAHSVIHSTRLGALATRRRLGEVLVIIAGAVLGHHEKQIPLWQKIYEANTWAMKEAKHRWRTQLAAESQTRARKKVLHLTRITHVRLRYHHPAVYQWARIARSGDSNGSKATRQARVDTDVGQALRPDGSERDHDQPFRAGGGDG